ncbi:MAG: ribosomal L7Ae/L30e/S12e/Gadd45 family protein [Gemmatimonadetes bacterium]|nr:ribosomal L7Ae/L30e/S12e/Gadd45 family protein [Gemmatimonadota bacterium]
MKRGKKKATGRQETPPHPDAFDERLKPRAAGLVRQARRAGRIVVGVALTRSAVRSGVVAAVLIAEDLKAERRDALIEQWKGVGITVFRGWSKDELGELAGKPAVAVLAITDRNIAAGLIDLASREALDLAQQLERSQHSSRQERDRG